METTTARKPKPTDEWITLEEASRALGQSRLASLTLIVKGDLVGQHIAGRTVVLRESVDALVASRAGTANDEAIGTASDAALG